MNWLKEYGIYVVLAVNLLLVWGGWSMRRAFASKEDLVAVSKAIAALDARVTAAEVQLDQLPDKDDFHELQLRLTETVGELKSISTLMQVERNNLVEQYRRHEAVLTRHEQIFAEAGRK